MRERRRVESTSLLLKGPLWKGAKSTDLFRLCVMSQVLYRGANGVLTSEVTFTQRAVCKTGTTARAVPLPASTTPTPCPERVHLSDIVAESLRLPASSCEHSAPVDVSPWPPSFSSVRFRDRGFRCLPYRVSSKVGRSLARAGTET